MACSHPFEGCGDYWLRNFPVRGLPWHARCRRAQRKKYQMPSRFPEVQSQPVWDCGCVGICSISNVLLVSFYLWVICLKPGWHLAWDDWEMQSSAPSGTLSRPSPSASLSSLLSSDSESSMACSARSQLHNIPLLISRWFQNDFKMVSRHLTELPNSFTEGGRAQPCKLRNLAMSCKWATRCKEKHLARICRKKLWGVSILSAHFQLPHPHLDLIPNGSEMEQVFWENKPTVICMLRCGCLGRAASIRREQQKHMCIQSMRHQQSSKDSIVYTPIWGQRQGKAVSNESVMKELEETKSIEDQLVWNGMEVSWLRILMALGTLVVLWRL